MNESETTVFVEQPLDSLGLLNMQGSLALLYLYLVSEETLPDTTPPLDKFHPVL